MLAFNPGFPFFSLFLDPCSVFLLILAPCKWVQAKRQGGMKCLLEKDANASTHSRLPSSLDLYRSEDAGNKVVECLASDYRAPGSFKECKDSKSLWKKKRKQKQIKGGNHLFISRSSVCAFYQWSVPLPSLGVLRSHTHPSRSNTHPSHSQTSHLLTSSLSLGVPVPRVTQCMWVVKIPQI